MKLIRRYSWSIFLFLACNAGATTMSKNEYDLLPAYCHNQGNVAGRFYKPNNETQWRNTLGANYIHIHHYCWSAVSIMRSYKAGLSDMQRRYHLTTAIADINYSLERSTEDFVLLPEMYTRLGELYLRLSDERNAQTAFERAWTINPSYSPPYLRWAQYLLKQGKTREALAIAEEGKLNAPDSPTLDKLLKEIQGTGRVKNK